MISTSREIRHQPQAVIEAGPLSSRKLESFC
jgi:hypothetical protein